VAASAQVPDSQIDEMVWQVHQGACPRCGGKGPVEVYFSYRVWSALILTSWRNQPNMVCRSCATKLQLTDAALSLVAGWWGLPWGVVLTPVQIGRNIAGMARTPDPQQPSEALRRAVRMQVGARVLVGQSPLNALGGSGSISSG
jgi:hypothetical protein